MKILIVSYYIPPLGRAAVKRTSKLAKYLRELGCDVKILTVKPIAYYAFDFSLLKDLEGIEIIRTESLDPSRILRILGKKTIKPHTLYEGISRSIVNSLLFPDAKIPWLIFSFFTAQKLKLHGYRPDVILSTSPPFTAHLIGLSLKHLLKAPLVMDFRDHWPTGILPANQFMKPMYNKFRKWLVKKADDVIAVAQDILDSLGKGHLIPSGYDPIDNIDFFRFNLVGEIPIAFAGSLSLKESEALGFIHAIKNTQKFTLHLAGVIPPKILKEVDGKKVFYHGYLEYRLYFGFLNSAKALWFTHPKEAPTASKLFEYLGLGKPLIATIPPNSEASMIIRRLNAGFVVEPERGKVLQVLKTIEEDPEILDKFDYQFVLDFSRKNLTLQLLEIFRNLTVTKGPSQCTQ